MTDDTIPGAMTMVKIDGAKVKLLRENQGLTQLYLATAVQVTTDTISRWENKRYPSIKKENGLNLAEALGVRLEDILETPAAIEAIDENIPAPQPLPGSPAGSSIIKRFWPLVILAATFAATLGGAGYYFFTAATPVALSAERSLPIHCIPGQPFPVIITVTGAPAGSAALILKEKFPGSAVLLNTVPKVNAGGVKNTTIKWLKKIEHHALFSYVLRIDSDRPEQLLFSGNVAMNRSSSESQPITGDTKISLGEYHWADTNTDNSISDSEILTVYDRYSEIEGLGLDIDLIEEIWLGSGYKWNRVTSSFEIFE